MVIYHLSKQQSKAAEGERFRSMDNSEWGPIAAQSMCDDTRGFPIPGGNGTLTMGNLYDRTPKNLISKVMLEEKVFETWYSGRVALLGDGMFMFSFFPSFLYRWMALFFVFMFALCVCLFTNAMPCPSNALHAIEIATTPTTTTMIMTISMPQTKPRRRTRSSNRNPRRHRTRKPHLLPRLNLLDLHHPDLHPLQSRTLPHRPGSLQEQRVSEQENRTQLYGTPSQVDVEIYAVVVVEDHVGEIGQVSTDGWFLATG